jgi:type III pantothenate kinase
MPSRRAPHLVVDVGNTRIKWGLCDAAAVVESASLAPDDSAAWQQQLDAWHLNGRLFCAVCGVHPQRRDRFTDWLRQRGDTVRLISSSRQLPLEVGLPHPGKVGIDRLLNAVAVNTSRSETAPAVIVDAGSAVTVDYVDQRGAFRGGAILPGLGLMARALHEYTALLPLIEVAANVELPGTSTVQAMKAGIFCAVVGGIREVLERLLEHQPAAKGMQVFVGGGNGVLLAPHLRQPTCLWPTMTLEGLRIAALPAEDK